MVSIPFPLSSSPGRTPQEGTGRLLNCYAEPLGKDLMVQKGYPVPAVTWRRCPGLTQLATAGDIGCRGFLEVNGTLYFAVKDKLYSITSIGGAATLVGTLAGTQKVFFARNNAATPDMMVVTENGSFTFTSSAVTSYGPTGFKSPNSATFLDGYIITSVGDGTLQATDLNAVTFNTLNVTKAEAKPDGLTRAITFGSQVFAFGPLSTEVYNDTANPTGFPLTRSFVMPRGLLSAAAVAGQEDGFGSALIWVADDNTVVQFTGSGTTKISPPDLDRLILLVPDKTKLEASVYVADGHAKWVLSSSMWTWEFDINTQKWNERDSYNFPRWQASQSVYAFGQWLVGQTAGNKILAINPLRYSEDGQPIRYRLESGPVSSFPSRSRPSEVYFNLSTGVGIAPGLNPIETDPVMLISWSDDGGVSWTNPVTRKIGAQGVAETTVSVVRTGMTGRQGRKWRIDITDPVYVGVMGGQQLVEKRAA